MASFPSVIPECSQGAYMSGYMEAGPSTSRLLNNAAAVDDLGSMSSEPRKKRIKRARKACLPCRTRKRRCGGAFPAACPNCQEDELACDWPVEDGRSMRLKKARKGSGVAEKEYTAGRLNSDEADEWSHIDGAHREELFSLTGDADHSLHPSHITATSALQQSLGATTQPVQSAQPSSSRLNGTQLPFSMPTSFNESVGSYGAQQQVENFLLSQHNASDASWLSGFDPESFIMALSSRIPTVEESSPALFEDWLQKPGATELLSGVSPKDTLEEKTVKISWWRPHGHTAIAPGLKRITLKVRVDRPRSVRQAAALPLLATPLEEPYSIIDPDGMPNITIMQHLLDLFIAHFGCQFPSLDQRRLQKDIESREGSTFLLNCIAATASRFSDHPAIALPGLERHSYGNVFLKIARDLLGSMLGVPSRDTVIALVLLAGLGHGIDSESEEWMMTGMAVRMAVDLGLHLTPGDDSVITEEERRLNRLTFWSVCLLDFSLSFGTGRETTFRIPSITQSLPTDADMLLPPGLPPSPFPAAAKQMLLYGPLIDILNGPHDAAGQWVEDAQTAIRRAVTCYNSLPGNMQWSASNFQIQARAQQGSIFLQLHLWMHTIIASAYLTGTDVRRPAASSVQGQWRDESLTPTSLAATDLWHNSARTIGDILVLSDVIDPFSYHALPFVNQAFFVAGSCYIKEVEMQQKKADSKRPEAITSTVAHNSTESGDLAKEKADEAELYRAVLKSVASNNISALQQGLAKQSIYWSGVAWVAQALEQRLSGVAAGAIDLGEVTDKLASFVSVPDPGVLRDGNQGEVF